MLTLRDYEEAARVAFTTQTDEQIMESTEQATQRKITLASMDLIEVRRPEIHTFNELLVQYPHGRPLRVRQVVPDNFIVLHDGPIDLRGSLSLNLPYANGLRPFWALEYVSRNNRRKDYDQNLTRYERHLQVPYYLLFEPSIEEMILYRRGKTKYITVKPNDEERYAIEEIDVEVAILDGWLRFWYDGELVPLSGELLLELDQTRKQRDEAVRQRDAAVRERDAERLLREAAERELAELRARLGLPGN